MLEERALRVSSVCITAAHPKHSAWCVPRGSHVLQDTSHPGYMWRVPVLVTLQGTGLRHSLRDHDHKIK